MIQVKKITYTPANIFAMFVTPQLVLPAPAAGYVNNIIGITHKKIFVSAVYTVGTVLLYDSTFAAGLSNYQDPDSLITNYDTNFPIKRDPARFSVISTQDNFYVTTDAQAATGDSNVIALIIFETKLLV